MENQRLILKIQSKYILKHILNHIEDKNEDLKLFSYSKYFQKKLDLNLSLCYKKYLEALNFELKDYLFKYEEKYEKGIFEKEYNTFISINNLNKEKFEHILFDVINNQNIITNEKDNYINIDSPLLEMMTKTNDFNKYFTLYISQIIIDKFQLKECYRAIISKLNNSNTKYSSILYVFNDKIKLSYLNELNINFNNIKTLNLKYKGDKIFNEDKKDTIINSLNSFKNLKNLVLKGNKSFIEIFENFNFEGIKILDLSRNYYISDLDLLENVKFDKLKKLDLSWNNISNINILESDSFKKLKELNLKKNKISKIRVLTKAKFNKLKFLDISFNKITDINVLKNVNFKKLIELALCETNISNIKFLKNANFKNLKILNLSDNKISNITVLGKVKFYKLETLYLNENKISNINILEKVNFRELKELYLFSNKISDITVLEKVKLDKLEILDLSYNMISDIKVLEKVKLYKLEELDLRFNKVLNVSINVSKIIYLKI